MVVGAQVDLRESTAYSSKHGAICCTLNNEEFTVEIKKWVLACESAGSTLDRRHLEH